MGDYLNYPKVLLCFGNNNLGGEEILKVAVVVDLDSNQDKG